jgi:hypothetical protein
MKHPGAYGMYTHDIGTARKGLSNIIYRPQVRRVVQNGLVGLTIYWTNKWVIQVRWKSTSDIAKGVTYIRITENGVERVLYNRGKYEILPESGSYGEKLCKWTLRSHW